MARTEAYKATIAKEIIADYVERFKPQVEPEQIMRNGQVIIVLNGGMVVVSDDNHNQVLYSANLNAMPQMIAIEAGWITKYQAGTIASEHCVNPMNGEVAEGSEDAMDMYMAVRIQEAKGIVAEMVDEAKAEQAKADEAPSIELDAPKIEA